MVMEVNCHSEMKKKLLPLPWHYHGHKNTSPYFSSITMVVAVLPADDLADYVVTQVPTLR